MFLHLKIVAVGKIKNQEIASLANEYQKRLVPFCKLEIIELPSIPFLHKNDENKSKQKEGEKILAYFKKKLY